MTNFSLFLSFLHKNIRRFTPVSSIKISLHSFFPPYFLFWEILKLNLTFAVSCKHDSKSAPDKLQLSLRKHPFLLANYNPIQETLTSTSWWFASFLSLPSFSRSFQIHEVKTKKITTVTEVWTLLKRSSLASCNKLIAHVRYIKILKWLLRFMANFLRLHCLAIPRIKTSQPLGHVGILIYWT